MQESNSINSKSIGLTPAGNVSVGLLAALLMTNIATAQPKPSPTKSTGSLVLNAAGRTSIVLPTKATPSEQQAAEELQTYLQRITGGKFTISPESSAAALKSAAIYVGDTGFARRTGVKPEALRSEEWLIRSQGNALIVQGGGTRGTLYAAYHLLEDNAGVRWWNPWEEAVPTGKTLSWGNLNRRGKPVFAYRDIYSHYRHDEGHFAARLRLNGQGNLPTSPAYGGSRAYGPPDHSHTTFLYLPPEKYFAEHPDWYIVPGGGTPTFRNAQLAYSNLAMRQEFLKALRENIRKSHADAAAKGLPLPDVFNVSQEDNRIGFISGPTDEELVKKEGSEVAILLDFLNFLADGIKDEFPGVYIDTLAYLVGEKAPKTMRVRDNVMVRLTDTTSNVLQPITAERNRDLRQKVESWGKVTPNLRIWDYAVTFDYVGLPEPTIHTYETDFRFWAARGVEGIFCELEFVILADMRDLKFWMYSKMLEDPHQDFSALLRNFTDGFYGPAGPMIREYLKALEEQAKAKNADIDWYSGPAKHTYLTLDFMKRADAILERAAKAVASDAVLSRRVRHARMPVDRATVVLFPTLMKQWRISGGDPNAILLNRDAMAARYLQSWNEQIDMRLPAAEQQEERDKAANEAKGLTAGPLYTPPPARFADVPPANLFDYGPSAMRLFRNLAKMEKDPNLESGLAARYELNDGEVARYKLPMTWGVHDTVALTYPLQSEIKEADVPGPGYHWIKLGTTKLTGHDQMYFFWSWHIQVDFDNAYDAAHPDALFDIWANIKFEGPAFPHGKVDEKNAISVERVVLVKK